MKRSLFILLVLCLALQVEAQSYRHQVRWSIGVGDEPHLKNVRNDYVRLFKLESDSSLFSAFQNINVSLSIEYLAVSTCKCTARKVKEYFRKNTQKGYENLIFLSDDGLFCQQLW